MALMQRTFTGKNVHPDCARSVRLLAATCADLGHVVAEVTPELDWDAYSWAIRTAGSASFAAGVEGAARAVGRVPSEKNLEPLTWLSYLEGRQLSAVEYFKALDTFALLQRSLGRFFERYDVLITPMLTQPPADIGWLGKPASDLDTFWEKFSGDAYSPFAGIFNVTGQPAASIPCLVTDDRRPVGVQIVARFGDEATLFGLSAQIEEARPWRDRLPPPVHVSNTTATGPFARAASHRSPS
jgi:amidase